MRCPKLRYISDLNEMSEIGHESLDPAKETYGSLHHLPAQGPPGCVDWPKWS